MSYKLILSGCKSLILKAGDSATKRLVSGVVSRLLASGILLFGLWAATSRAADGTWTTNDSGLWSTAANWSSGTIADGVDFTANFNFNHSADLTVTLDSSRTIGNLIFGDTTPSSDWFLNASGGSILTLQVSSGTPTIQVSNRTTTISLGLAGSQGFTKTGAGTLVLSGSNTYSGITTISAGQVTLGNVNGLGTGGLTINSGTLELNGNSISLANLSGTGGTIQETANTVVTLTVGSDNTSTIFGGTLTDGVGNRILSLTKIGTGTLTLTGTNTTGSANGNKGVTTVNDGVLRLNNASALSSDNLTLNGGVLGLGVADFIRALGGNANQVQFTGSGGFAAYTLDRNVNLGGASALVTWNTGSFVPTGSALILGASDADKIVTFQNPIALNGAPRTIQVNGAGAIISGQLIGAGSSGLTKTGNGTLSLTASNTYSGGTTINGGRLLVNNAAGSGTGSGSVIVNSGGTLGGIGIISGTITLNSGSTISAGNSPGTLNTGSQIWNGGATNLFEIRQAGGTEGTDRDLLNITGGLTINATSGNKFVIDIRSLTLADTPGDVSDFNNGLSYDWRIAKTTTGITGFNATVFELLLAGYSNGLGGGTFSLVIANGNNDLVLHFTPVPEASTYVLMGFGLLILGCTWRRHRV